MNGTDAGVIADAGDAGSDAGLDPDGCRALELGPRSFQFNLFGQLTGLNYEVSPNLDGARADTLLFELYDSSTGGLPVLAPGTFDLAVAPNDDLATCQHCFWIKVDESETGTVAAIYYQAEGELTLEIARDPFEPLFKGSAERVVLRRATIDENGHVTFVENGDCVSLENFAVDTSPTPGEVCYSAEDCGNELLEICNPSSNTCDDPQCGEFLSCTGNNTICISQYRDVFFGGCYDVCDPSAAASTCSDGLRCVQFGVDPAFGICKYIGEGVVGASCEPSDNSTGCIDGAVCSELSRTCAASCTFFDEETNCTSEQVCSLFGVCEPAASGVAVGFGEACGNVELASGCAADGEAFRGICWAYDFAPLICEKACLGEQGCDGGEFCAMRFSSGLGICLPIPVCGDGVRGEINELCDDGNTASGDGCSADCTVVEYDVLCMAAPVLPYSIDLAGDTATAVDGFQSSCQLGTARAAVYTLTPPGPGRLSLQLTSATDQTLSLRTACEDAGSELSCAQQGIGGELEQLVVQITSTNAAALTAVVSAFTVLEEGPFVIRADFVPEDCGDGVIAGNEGCDDGNELGDDGCSSDCRTIEYDVYCAEAPILSTTTPNTGDTTGDFDLYLNECSANLEIPSSGDNLYRYVAPANGTLHLLLESTENLVIAVLDGCGKPDTMTPLGCNSVFTLGTLDVHLVTGQEVTVLVDGFLPRDQGAYSLGAMFVID